MSNSRSGRPGLRLPALPGLQTCSVRTRLILWNMLILSTLFLILGAVTLQLVRSIMLASIDRELTKRALRFAEEADLRQSPRPHLRRPEGRGQPDPTRSDSGFDRPQIIDLNGNVLVPANAREMWDTRAFKVAARGEEVLSTITMEGYPFRVVSRAFPPEGSPAGVVQIPYPLTEMNRAIAGLANAFMLLLPLALIGAAAGGYALTAAALSPVRRMAQAASRIDAQRLSERLPVAGKDEFWNLARVINSMLDRLEEAVERERQFTADASHELRTPLAIIKANTSLCLSGTPSSAHMLRSIQMIDGTVDSMTRLAQDLLLLARSDSGQIVRHPIELLVADVVHEAVRRIGNPERATIRVDIASPSLSVLGDEDDLVRLLANLLENAQRYTPADGTISIGVQERQETVCISVVDTGIGIAAEHLPHLGERFYRVDAARSRPDGGTGLGLAIARSIVMAHHGTIEFDSILGVGTTVRVILPMCV